MQRIRRRPRLDTLINQRCAASPVSWGRRVYLAVILLLALVLADYAVGDALLLRADGLLLTERYVLAATYPARVAAVRVREGERVDAGTVLLDLESADTLKDLTDLAARNADLALRETQLRVRQATLSSLLPLAERHARESAGAVRKIDIVSARGLVSAQRLDQALASSFEATAKLAELRGQAETLAEELTLVQRSRQRAAEALAQLEAFYDRGAVRAPAAGIVGARVPVPGQVARFADELLQVNGARAHVLAYVPDLYLFPVRSGDRVDVSAGGVTVPGVVEAVLGVADALPAEFQNMFRPRDRSRLLRVSLPSDHGFAVSQKVRVRGCVTGWCGATIAP